MNQVFFFSCIAVLVRDIVGQQLEWVTKKSNFPESKSQQKQHTNQTKQHPQKAKPGKDPGKFANKVKQVKHPRPSQAPHKFSSTK